MWWQACILQHSYAAVLLVLEQQSAALVWSIATTAGMVQLLTRSSCWPQPSHHRHYAIGGSTIYEWKRLARFFVASTHKRLHLLCLFSRRQYSTL